MERGVSVLTEDWDPPSHLARVCEGRERGGVQIPFARIVNSRKLGPRRYKVTFVSRSPDGICSGREVFARAACRVRSLRGMRDAPPPGSAARALQFFSARRAPRRRRALLTSRAFAPHRHGGRRGRWCRCGGWWSSCGCRSTRRGAPRRSSAPTPTCYPPPRRARGCCPPCSAAQSSVRRRRHVRDAERRASESRLRRARRAGVVPPPPRCLCSAH